MSKTIHKTIYFGEIAWQPPEFLQDHSTTYLILRIHETHPQCTNGGNIRLLTWFCSTYSDIHYSKSVFLHEDTFEILGGTNLHWQDFFIPWWVILYLVYLPIPWSTSESQDKATPCLYCAKQYLTSFLTLPGGWWDLVKNHCSTFYIQISTLKII